MEIYIAGKIAGLDFPKVQAKFETAKADLVAGQHHAHSPLDVGACAQLSCNGYQRSTYNGSWGGAPKLYQHSWECYLKHDLAYMLSHCNAVALLPDWYDSPGARFEAHVAGTLGFIIRPIERWLGLQSLTDGHQTASDRHGEMIASITNRRDLAGEFRDAHIIRGEQ